MQGHRLSCSKAFILSRASTQEEQALLRTLLETIGTGTKYVVTDGSGDGMGGISSVALEVAPKWWHRKFWQRKY